MGMNEGLRNKDNKN